MRVINRWSSGPRGPGPWILDQSADLLDLIGIGPLERARTGSMECDRVSEHQAAVGLCGGRGEEKQRAKERPPLSLASTPHLLRPAPPTSIRLDLKRDARWNESHCCFFPSSITPSSCRPLGPHRRLHARPRYCTPLASPAPLILIPPSPTPYSRRSSLPCPCPTLLLSRQPSDIPLA